MHLPEVVPLSQEHPSVPGTDAGGLVTGTIPRSMSGNDSSDPASLPRPLLFFILFLGFSSNRYQSKPRTFFDVGKKLG